MLTEDSEQIEIFPLVFQLYAPQFYWQFSLKKLLIDLTVNKAILIGNITGRYTKTVLHFMIGIFRLQN